MRSVRSKNIYIYRLFIGTLRCFQLSDFFLFFRHLNFSEFFNCSYFQTLEFQTSNLYSLNFQRYCAFRLFFFYILFQKSRMLTKIDVKNQQDFCIFFLDYQFFSFCFFSTFTFYLSRKMTFQKPIFCTIFISTSLPQNRKTKIFHFFVRRYF